MSASRFNDLLAQKRIVACVGSGGVGKTTTAAALALHGARTGRRTLVLTIDPAKRLANSLGLDNLGHTIQQVPTHKLDAAGPRAPNGELWAMMLDQKAAFDEVVRAHATAPEAIARILANPVYGQISGSLAGSQEYAALAKLHDFDQDGQFDFIVVDTPPTAHALDFLDAPRKLTEAIDSPAIEWFRKLRQGSGQRGFSMAGRTGAYVLKRLAKFVGSQFLDDIAVFFTEFNEILAGFRERAETVFELLRQDKVGFALVCSPDPMAVDEALYFHKRLITSDMPFAAFIVNKIHSDLPIQSSPTVLTERLARRSDVAALALPPSVLADGVQKLLANHAGFQTLAHTDQDAIARLRTAGGDNALVLQVPLFRQDVHDPSALARIGRYLFRSTE